LLKTGFFRQVKGAENTKGKSRQCFPVKELTQEEVVSNLVICKEPRNQRQGHYHNAESFILGGFFQILVMLPV
jgi:hypothetical protein